MSRLVAEFGTGELFWSMIWFTLFFLWIWLLVVVFGDIFRSDDLGGWAKAAWVVFVIVLPWLGVLVYLIARGRKMQENALKQAQDIDRANRAYITSVAGAGAGGAGAADEIAKLADLKSRGAITDEEFAAAKARALGA
jgi:hypothetical protein